MRLGWAGRLSLALLTLDAVLLATVELFFLPLRLPATLGGWPLPLSILLAAVSTPLLVRAAAELAPRTLVTGTPLAAWLLTVIVLGLAGPGGDIVLSANVRSLLLVAAGVLPGGIILGQLTAASLVRAAGPQPDPVGSGQHG